MSNESLQLTAIIEREDDWYVATCPEVDVVSQGKTIEDARSNLLEAVERFFERLPHLKFDGDSKGANYDASL